MPPTDEYRTGADAMAANAAQHLAIHEPIRGGSTDRAGKGRSGLLCGLLIAFGSASGETRQCTEIATVPTTLSTPGVYCLKKDLSTAITSGVAIGIAANDVTLDCNGFKLGGLAAGPSSFAKGISASGTTCRKRVTVRSCNVRGFHIGINLLGSCGGGSADGEGHRVLDNRLDGNLYTGIQVNGPGAQVLRNRVANTGGASGQQYATGIIASGDVIGNTVDRVFASAANTYPTGINIDGIGSLARDNHVRDLVVAGTGYAYGILGRPTVVLVGNSIAQEAVTPGIGIPAVGNGSMVCQHNRVFRYQSNIGAGACSSGLGNAVLP